MNHFLPWGQSQDPMLRRNDAASLRSTRISGSTSGPGCCVRSGVDFGAACVKHQAIGWIDITSSGAAVITEEMYCISYVKHAIRAQNATPCSTIAPSQAAHISG